jgi:hypothetical protein
MEHLYIIADTDSCDTLPFSICEKCPLAKFKKRDDGSYTNCADAVGFKSRGDKSYSKAAVVAIIDSLVEVDE